MTFSYFKGHTNTPYSIRIDVDQVDLTDISPDFQTRNCLYPMANGPEDAYKGVRRDYERECNVQGWQLAHLNPAALDGERGLLQRAVNSFRNLDGENRSRRMKRRDKVANGTLQRRAVRPVMDFRMMGEQSVQAPLGPQSLGREQGQERSEDAGTVKSVGLKWKQILVPPLDGSSQGPTELIVTNPSIADDDPPQEAAIASDPPSPPPAATNELTSLPVSLPELSNNINLLEFQGYIQGQFQSLQINVSVDQVQLDSLDFEFKKRNGVYPRSFLDTHESPHWNTFGIRQAEESYLNEIGWKLCWLNQELLDGKKLLLQQALDAYRRRFLPITAQPRARIGFGLLTTRRRSISGLPPVVPTGQLLQELEQEQEKAPSSSSQQRPQKTQRVRFNVQDSGRRRSIVSIGKRLESREEQDESDDSGGLGEDLEETDEMEEQEDEDNDNDEETTEHDEEDEDEDDGDEEDEEESGEGSSSEDVSHSQMSLLSFTGAIQTYSLGTGSGSARSRPRITPAETAPGSGTLPISQKRVADTPTGPDKRPKRVQAEDNDEQGHDTAFNVGSASRRSAENSGATDNEGGSRYLLESDQQEEDDWWITRLHSSHHPKDHYLVNMTTEELIGALTSGYNR
ncbi:hypothetical protein BGZ52_002132 [Haplosporangium bisporale]|nr:hypothetical protein BGZ52_002132 [Haplosporangium bisporale]